MLGILTIVAYIVYIYSRKYSSDREYSTDRMGDQKKSFDDVVYPCIEPRETGMLKVNNLTT